MSTLKIKIKQIELRINIPNIRKTHSKFKLSLKSKVPVK